MRVIFLCLLLTSCADARKPSKPKLAKMTAEASCSHRCSRMQLATRACRGPNGEHWCKPETQSPAASPSSL